MPNASGHRTERATRAPVRCTALLARDAKHPQDLVPVAAERHTHRAIIESVFARVAARHAAIPPAVRRGGVEHHRR